MDNNNKHFRTAIYPKDVAQITGKSVKSASRLIVKIKKELGKNNHQILTISEFCDYMGIKIQDIEPSLLL